MVPLTRELLTIDYVAQKQYPLVFVTSGRLGSINHTLLSLEAMTRRGIRLHTLAYNLFPEEDDEIYPSRYGGIHARPVETGISGSRVCGGSVFGY